MRKSDLKGCTYEDFSMKGCPNFEKHPPKLCLLFICKVTQRQINIYKMTDVNRESRGEIYKCGIYKASKVRPSD